MQNCTPNTLSCAKSNSCSQRSYVALSNECIELKLEILNENEARLKLEILKWVQIEMWIYIIIMQINFYKTDWNLRLN